MRKIATLFISFLILVAIQQFSYSQCSYDNEGNANAIEDRLVMGSDNYWSKKSERRAYEPYTKFEKMFIVHDPATDYHVMSSGTDWY